MSDPAFAPFWKKAEELGALVIIHPNGFTKAKRLSRFYFNNVIGNPFETTLALHYLIFDGVLERHPNLKIFAMHGGGYLGAYSGRIDHAWGARSDCHANLPKPPTSYLKKVYVDTVVFTPGQLKALVDTFGARPCHHGHRLSLRHGGERSDRPRGSVDSFDAEDPRRDRRRQCEEDAGDVNRSMRARKSSTAVSAMTAASVLCARRAPVPPRCAWPANRRRGGARVR